MFSLRSRDEGYERPGYAMGGCGMLPDRDDPRAIIIAEFRSALAARRRKKFSAIARCSAVFTVAAIVGALLTLAI